jgi:hypothetical protein
MAMNKQAWYIKGAKLAHDHHAKGILPADGYPVTASDNMALAMSGTWQAMAMKQGYNAVRKALYA